VAGEASGRGRRGAGHGVAGVGARRGQGTQRGREKRGRRGRGGANLAVREGRGMGGAAARSLMGQIG
jgi:hypothetical protein